MSATWRLVKKARTKGPYFQLQKGRARQRTILTLGYTSEAEAERAHTQVQVEEDRGKIGRVLRLFKRDREGAINYLAGDPGVRELLGPAEPDYSGMTLREYYDAVYAEARATEKPRSWPSEQRHWVKILDSIGDVRLYRIDHFALADHLDGLVVTRGKRAGEPASGNTKRLHRAALQALFKWAYRRRHVESLPDFGIFQIKGASKTVRDKPDPLTLAELMDLLRACEEPRHRALFAVGAGQGLRPSELVRLDWADIDWDGSVMRVVGTKAEASADTIPMTPLVVRELGSWWRRCGEPTEGLMFPARWGKPYARPTGYRKALAEAAKRAGLTRRVYPYLLRDSFATIAWSVGIEKDVARRVLRHTDEKMLDRVYCRPRPQQLVDAVAAFDAE